MTTPQETERALEELSEQVHKLYCIQYEKDHGEPYWTNGDYSKLDERMKEYDRNIARFVISAQEAAAKEAYEKAINIVLENASPSNQRVKIIRTLRAALTTVVE